MPTDALLTLGMLKLTSLMMESFRTIAVKGGGCLRQWAFQLAANSGILNIVRQADAACSNDRDVVLDGGVCEMQVVMGLMSVWLQDQRDRMSRALGYHDVGMDVE